jgi:hypothetical protein
MGTGLFWIEGTGDWGLIGGLVIVEWGFIGRLTIGLVIGRVVNHQQISQ